MQFSGNFKGKTPILSKFWVRPPLGPKLCWAPLTKILDPPLDHTTIWFGSGKRISNCKLCGSLSNLHLATSFSTKPTVSTWIYVFKCIETQNKGNRWKMKDMHATEWSNSQTSANLSLSWEHRLVIIYNLCWEAEIRLQSFNDSAYLCQQARTSLINDPDPNLQGNLFICFTGFISLSVPMQGRAEIWVVFLIHDLCNDFSTRLLKAAWSVK